LSEFPVPGHPAETGLPAIIDGGSPFNKGFTPAHEYMGTVVKLGMYGLDVMSGIIAGEPVVVLGPGPIGLMGVGIAKGPDALRHQADPYPHLRTRRRAGRHQIRARARR